MGFQVVEIDGASFTADGRLKVAQEPPIPPPATTPVEIGLNAAKASKLTVLRAGYDAWVRSVRPTPNEKLTVFARLQRHKK